MEIGNVNRSLSHTVFILFGFPGLKTFRPLLAIPFSSIYAVLLGGNSVVVYAIVLEKSLHSLMYLLIASLLAVNVVCTSAIIPKLLLGLFGSNQITLAGCQAQIFTVYSSVMAETVLLLLMAVDRYLAISRPLQYNTIITRHLTVHFSVNLLLRLCCLVFPLMNLISSLHYCKSNVIYHFLCENMMLFNLACGDNSQTKIVTLAVRIVVTLFDVCVILISYSMVLHAVMRITAGVARHKALHTCGTHLLVVSFMYTSGIISVLLPQTTTSYDTQNASSVFYFLFSPLINPFIYGMRMKEIRLSLLRRGKGHLTSNDSGRLVS